MVPTPGRFKTEERAGALWLAVGVVLSIVLIVVLLLFGRGRVSEIMGDFGKGISSFKKGLNETEDTAAKTVRIGR